MWRRYQEHLNRWLKDPARKPLILRGARQVGKTWLVRRLAEENGYKLVEINFEQTPEARRYFASNRPAQILDELSFAFGRSITPDRTLLYREIRYPTACKACPCTWWNMSSSQCVLPHQLFRRVSREGFWHTRLLRSCSAGLTHTFAPSIQTAPYHSNITRKLPGDSQGNNPAGECVG
jgi:hypothetical protein